MDTRIGIVTGRKVALNRGRGVNTRLLQVMLTDVNDVQTVQLIEQMGEESNPPNGCMIAVIPGAKAFKLGVATFDGIEPNLSVGGKRIYSIDPSDHSVVAEIRLDPDGKITLTGPNATQVIDPDGTVTVSNQSASFIMNSDGSFLFNGTSTVFNHTVTVPELKFGSTQKTLTDHRHSGVQTGSGNTGVPV